MMKQVIVLRTDLKMRRGKEIAQGAHASMAAILPCMDHPYVKEWLVGKFTKIAVGCDSEAELHSIAAAAKALGLPCAAIQDSGATEFNGVPTWTAVAVGPGPEALVNEVTGSLKLR
jgi:PTH2 family peptidyl-tRNA hydrolase